MERFSSMGLLSEIPQGSILEPILFYIFINDLSKSRDTQIAIYADDTAVYASWNTTMLTCRLQKHIVDNVEFFANWKMSINSEKTEAIIFIRKKVSIPPLIRILNYEVPWFRKVKFLDTK